MWEGYIRIYIMWNPLQVSHYIPCLLHCAHFVSNCLTVWSPHLKCILQRLLYSYIVALFMVKVGEKKHLQFVMTLSCHRSNVFSPPPPPTFLYMHTHTSQTMCAVLRMSEYVVSHKTGVMSLIGRGRITWHRIPSDQPIPALRLTAVAPRRVRNLRNHFTYRFCSLQ